MSTQVAHDEAALLGRHEQVIADHRAFDAEALEAHARGAQMLDAGRDDAELGLRDRRESDERADLDVIGADAVRRAVKRPGAVDGDRVRADPLDRRAHRDEKLGEVLHVRLARGVAEGGRARGQARRHERVLRSGDARLVEEDIGAAQPLRAQHVLVADLHDRSELLQGEKVRIDATPADDIAARGRQSDAAASREERPREQDRRTNARAQHGIERARLHDLRLDDERVARGPLGGDAEGVHELDQRLAVANSWYVFEGDLLIGEERCGDDRQRGVLVSRWMDRAGERASTFDDVAERGGQWMSEWGQGTSTTGVCSRMCARAEGCPWPLLQVKESA